MRKSRLLCLLLFLISAGTCLAQGSRKIGTFKLTDVSYTYSYYLPSEYDSINSYPAIIGPGEGVAGSDRSFFWNVSDPEQYGWILIEFSFWKQNSNVVEALLKELNKRFNIEGDKFHIIGFSANSASCFGHAISNPKYFHSITTIPGHPSSKNVDQMKSIKNVKIQNIVGEKDSAWLEPAREFEDLYKQLGLESKLEIIPNGEHTLNTLMGKELMDRMELMRK